MGHAYNQLSQYGRLLKVNILSINTHRLLVILRKISQGKSLDILDLNAIRHEGTNYDDVLKSINKPSDQVYAYLKREATCRGIVVLQQLMKQDTILSRFLQLEAEHRERGNYIRDLNRSLARKASSLGEYICRLEKEG